MDAAYVETAEGAFLASPLTRGPWHPDHQHAGPPSALICRAVEREGAREGLTHVARLTVNLLRPAPIGECRVEVTQDYLGRTAGHYSGRLIAGAKDIARFTALAQREEDLPVPAGTPGHPPPHAPKPPEECPVVRLPFKAWSRRLRRSRREPAGGGEILRWPVRGVVPPEPSADRRRGAEPLSARRGRGRLRQRHQRLARLREICIRQLRSHDQPFPPSGRGHGSASRRVASSAATAAASPNPPSTTKPASSARQLRALRSGRGERAPLDRVLSADLVKIALPAEPSKRL